MGGIRSDRPIRCGIEYKIALALAWQAVGRAHAQRGSHNDDRQDDGSGERDSVSVTRSMSSIRLAAISDRNAVSRIAGTPRADFFNLIKAAVCLQMPSTGL